MRPVDGDDLIKRCEYVMAVGQSNGIGLHSISVEALMDYIKSMPTALPEITRCRDCKYWMPHSQLGFDEDNDEFHDYCKRLIPEDEFYAFRRGADEWCSRAERRKDATD